MERTQLFDLMGELKLYGMKAAFDEIMTTAIKRQHEPQRIVGDLLNTEINEKQARSIKYQLTIAKLPLAKDLDDFQFEALPSTKRSSMTSLAAASSPNNAMLSWSAGPSLLHNAHLSMSLEFKSFLQGTVGRRTSQTAGCRRALYVASVQVGGADDPRRSLTELIRRQLTIFDQTAHGRRTNG